MKYLTAMYLVGFAIAIVLFGWPALIHPLLTGLIVGLFLMCCNDSEKHAVRQNRLKRINMRR